MVSLNIKQKNVGKNPPKMILTFSDGSLLKMNIVGNESLMNHKIEFKYNTEIPTESV